MLYLAPMCNVTELPYRILCRRYGAQQTVTEMVCARALYRKKAELKIIPSEVIQLFGHEPKYMKIAVEYVQQFGPGAIDLNAACPVKKVVKKGEGCAMLNDLANLSTVIESMVSVSEVPVTVKVRAGYTKENIAEIGKAVEQAGASMITLHARLGSQMYSGKANWEWIKLLKETVSIPVIGNGNVRSLDDARWMMRETGCDHVMIGRAAMGNPFVFSGEKKTARNALEAYDALMQLYEKHGMLDTSVAKKHALWFIAGFPQSHSVKTSISTSKSTERIFEIIRAYLGQLA